MVDDAPTPTFSLRLLAHSTTLSISGFSLLSGVGMEQARPLFEIRNGRKAQRSLRWPLGTHQRSFALCPCSLPYSHTCDQRPLARIPCCTVPVTFPVALLCSFPAPAMPPKTRRTIKH